MVHEIRNPLQVLLMPTERKDREQTPDFQKFNREGAETVRMILNNQINLEQNNISDFTLSPAPANLKSHIKYLVEMYKSLAAEKKLFINLHLDSQIPDTIIYDHKKLNQVISNLFNNAIKFTRKGGIFVIVEWIDPVSDERILSSRLSESARQNMLNSYELNLPFQAFATVEFRPENIRSLNRENSKYLF